MSDVVSSSSTSTSSAGTEEYYSFEDTPNYFWMSSSRGNSEEDELAPSKETVGAALDEYVSASKGGRKAYSNGDLYNAVKEFDKALDIELQTEMDCLYDTSIGFMSGLVRNEVEVRLKHNITNNQKCAKILDHLRDLYSHAASERVRAKKTDAAQCYLQMGAALVVINEWDKAKAVYTEGMSVCKERKELKTALKNLIKIEQITSCAEIPAEDHPDVVTNIPSPDQSPAPSPPLRPKHDCPPAQSPRLKHDFPPSLSLRPKHDRPPSLSPRPKNDRPPRPKHDRSPHLKRDRSMSASIGLIRLSRTRDRTGSLNLEECRSLNDPNEVMSFNDKNVSRTSSPMTKRDSSPRLSFKIFNSKRRYSLGKPASSVNVLPPEDTEAWRACFKPASCPVVISHTDFQPSAITHMRRLTIDDGGTKRDEGDNIKDEGGGGGGGEQLNNFNAVQFTSMRIEDDDSELEDSD